MLTQTEHNNCFECAKRNYKHNNRTRERIKHGNRKTVWNGRYNQILEEKEEPLAVSENKTTELHFNSCSANAAAFEEKQKNSLKLKIIRRIEWKSEQSRRRRTPKIRQKDETLEDMKEINLKDMRKEVTDRHMRSCSEISEYWD